MSNRIQISDDRAGQRLDNYLFGQLKNVPKTGLYKLIRQGQIRVNSRRVKPEYRLVEGDEIRLPPKAQESQSLSKPRFQPPTPLADRLTAAILYEDSHYLILNKPFGMAVHGGSGLSFGLIEALKQLRPLDRELELVHRLDKETSGCLIVAKRRSSLRAFHALLREGSIEKEYHAILHGRPASRWISKQALRKKRSASGEWWVEVSPEGLPSQTKFSVLQQFKDHALVEAHPLTGRTHQIRIHALCQGHPVVGDPKYGSVKMNKPVRQQQFKRMFLHAHRLRFQCPRTGIPVEVSAPYDSEYQAFLDYLNNQ